VRSFDLAKVNEFVEVCDMANVPLEDNSVDVAVFCLSLMGTNFLGFVREACRYAKLQYVLLCDWVNVAVRFGLRRSSHGFWILRFRVS